MSEVEKLMTAILKEIEIMRAEDEKKEV